jgi:predicted ArsR family transcriptional regulator
VKFGVTEERSAEHRTRDEVARLLLEQGPATATSLGTRLGLSPAAVRRHLDALVTDRMVAVRDQRPLGHRGRGRPAKVFALTESGREAFPHAYDDLAAAALRYLAEVHGEDAVAAFAEHRLAPLEDRHRDTVAAAGSALDRLKALAAVLTREGYAASLGPPPSPPEGSSPGPAGAGAALAVMSGGQLCQHHCPVAHVAAEFPQLCEAETRVFQRMLGTHVQRLATIARGDGVCTTHVPAARSTTTPTPGSGRKPI